MRGRMGSSPAIVLGMVSIVAVAGSACGSGSGTDPNVEERRLGLIVGFNNDDPRVVIPDTVQAGTEFTVQVTTYGNSCFRKGEAEVASSGNSATITPYDYVDVGRGVCESILFSFVHEAVVQFPEAGAASVTIVGRAGGALDDEVIEVTRDVMVLWIEASK